MNYFDNLTVSLSAGGTDAELAAAGLGLEHINELMIRIARKLLRDQHQLAFGGTLGDPSNELTSHLIEAALDWTNEEAPDWTATDDDIDDIDEATDGVKKTSRPVDINRPQTWPVMNHSAWPFHTYISAERRAELVGVCRFIDINPPGIPKSDLESAVTDWRSIPQATKYAADALTEMRDRSARETDMRIVWAGKALGSRGWMAGILEEVGFSLQHSKPVLILGGFGGCGGLLAEFLRQPDATWPADLSLTASASEERDALLSSEQRNALEHRLTRIREDLTRYRADLYSKDLIDGIKCDLLQEALNVMSPGRAIGIAHEAVAQRQEFLQGGQRI